MRPSCFNCARKHLAQAIVLMIESEMGYPVHRWLAIGHMAEAEAELLGADKSLAHTVREQRKLYEQDPEAHISLLKIIELISEHSDASS